MSTTSTLLIFASGGALARNRRPNSARLCRGPCTSTKTAPESLPTKPVRRSSVAIRWTKGRNPTPCTTPVTVNRCRAVSDRTNVSVMSTAKRLYAPRAACYMCRILR
ncbi:hypothetical protein I553_7155 [Mycobacterium xenopi 4042]|uniref:Uncharacterized protein n=1 Tax=Mycobacterium xenopi 4042 TaxID=1299334 RepID=X7Z5V6_MYCXE|nr:hypothetical protein I553_7155 [Mycobacterium xenopi 4042]